MDWDVDPTAFSEYVTIGAKGGELPPEVVAATNDGFANPDPRSRATDLGGVGLFTDLGPADHGALFEMELPEIDPGESVAFTLWYGAAGTTQAAREALGTSVPTLGASRSRTSRMGRRLEAPTRSPSGCGSVSRSSRLWPPEPRNRRPWPTCRGTTVSSFSSGWLARWPYPIRWAPVTAAMLALTSCTQASPQGTAVLRNATDVPSFEVVVRDPEGRRIAGGALEEVYIFDTQFTNRKRQCLVARDGGFTVLGPDGEVVASHRFADRPVCELEELTLREDGSLVWK